VEKQASKKTDKQKSPPKLFGTDGIRGQANEFPMLPSIVVKVGQAIGVLLKKNKLEGKSPSPKVVIGKDTRLSGYMIEMALASGLNSMGVHVQLVGPLPTPGIGFITRNMRADAGIVISASHNPYSDNGIKIFGADGFKIPDEMEREIERLIFEDRFEEFLAKANQLGRSRRIDDAQGRYIVHAKNTFPMDQTLDGLRIVLDTANGASYKVAKAVFEELGAEVIQIGNEPNGLNINDKAGALYPTAVANAVMHFRADVGVSLDGDADRVMMVDEKGQVLNGDHILGICAIHMKKNGTLKNNQLVVTHMSNFGLEKVMRQNGINVIKVNVGDKYVVEELRRSGGNLGGEQSGHIIFLDHSTTGDGCVAALNVLAVMRESKKRLSDLQSWIEEVPQILINVRVKKRAPLNEIKGYKELVEKVTAELGEEGRVFIRFSGTEPVIRILVEGPDRLRIHDHAQEIAQLLEKELM
jgi:phosphoglucosamine mutase